MSSFAGFLLRNSKGNTIDKYIVMGSYKSTPNQREEILAYREENTRELHRVTAQGKISGVEFDLKPIRLSQRAEIEQFFSDALVDKLQRKIYLTYWNDESMTYKDSYFYIPDIKYTIKTITKDDISYDSVSISLVEYKDPDLK